jgi:hypothetical protein
MLAVALSGLSLAQQHDPREEPPRNPPPQVDDELGQDAAQPDQPGRPIHRRPPPGRGGFPLGLPLPPSPEDEGPLKPGELDALMEFARVSLPEMHGLMQRMRDRNPAEFERRFGERAPRLRFLKRVFEQNPRLGELILQHTRKQKDIMRARQAVRRSPEDGRLRREAMLYMRDRVAESIQAEAQIFDELANMLAANRAGEVDKWLGVLLAADFDPIAQPPRVREMLDAYQTAAAESQPAIEQELRAHVERRLDDRIEGLRRRAERLRQAGPREVDARIQHLMEGPDRPPRPDFGPPPHRRGGGDGPPQDRPRGPRAR